MRSNDITSRFMKTCRGLAPWVIGLIILLGFQPDARALPSYARQTGQQCAACHNGFPELTPYGRLFKLNGYVFGGGQSDALPFAVMTYASITHTQVDQPGGASQWFGPNNNIAVDQTAVFYGGAIAPNLGAFAQITFDGVARGLAWDNTDIRYARTTQLFGSETILGVSLNNNPTVQDVWNTTPAWSFPFVASALAPTPAAATLIEGGLAQQVVGLTTYVYWNRLVYFEFGGYASLAPSWQSALGVNSASNNSLNGVSPYWRVALQQDWGRNSFEAGVFGIAASLSPQRVTGFGADHMTDIGIDSQYQFLADRDSVSAQVSAIFENQNLSASGNPAVGFAANTHNELRSYHAKASYYFEQTYGLTLGAFRVQGTPDAIIYASSPTASPNSTGLITELDFIAFNHGGPDFWPELNLKLGAQYTYYPEFDGMTGSAATDNNTLYLFAWLAF
jgi:hypothetical protein